MDFFGPQGPSSFDTHGLLISITFVEQEEIRIKAKKIVLILVVIFFIVLHYVKRFLYTTSLINKKKIAINE